MNVTLAHIAGDIELETCYTDVQHRFRKFNKLMNWSLGLLISSLLYVVPYQYLKTVADQNLTALPIVLLFGGGTMITVYAQGQRIQSEDRAFLAAWDSMKDMERYQIRQSDVFLDRALGRVKKIRNGLPTVVLTSHRVVIKSTVIPARKLSQIIKERFRKEQIKSSQNYTGTILALKLLATYFMRPSVALLETVIADMDELMPAGISISKRQSRILALARTYYRYLMQVGVSTIAGFVVFWSNAYFFGGSPSTGFATAVIAFLTLLLILKK